MISKKRSFLSTLLLFFVFSIFSQIQNPVNWDFSKEQIDKNKFELIFEAEIQADWLIYGVDFDPGGPIPTNIVLEENPHYTKKGDLNYPEAKIYHDPHFDMEIPVYSENVKLTQLIKVLTDDFFEIKGELVYMACDDVSCLPPDYIDFVFKINEDISTEKIAGTDKQDAESSEITPKFDIEIDEEKDTDKKEAYYEPVDVKEERSIWWNFILGLMGGVLALLTPCVFPLIPLTVSFFIKNSKNRRKALRDALIYGLSIIFVYVVIGIAVSIIFGADRLNALATSPGFNIFFFALLVFFAISFFGAFELRLPTSWSNKLDSKVDKTGGVIGVFLMGLIFVLVSFSCTGPIVGTLLVEAAMSFNILAPVLGMAGFSIALAIPFTLFAIFPAALNSLPKSGGWMNAIKVVLGFIVLAFSLKFLSTADTVGQWNLFSREGFIVIWIAIFSLMGLYLIGVIRFANDSKQEFLSIPRLFLSIGTFAFVFYLLPGLWGAPLTTVSPFLPPLTKQSFDISQKHIPGHIQETGIVYEGESVKEGPHGLKAFTDYEEGLSFAKKKNKPVFVDFTGLACANCRRMESIVWSDPRVLERLKNNFVKISLYVDDRTELPEQEQFVSDAMGRERTIRTVGQKWSVFQAERFQINTQPFYVIMDSDENILVEPRGYNSNINEYIEFLDKGYENFKNSNL